MKFILHGHHNRLISALPSLDERIRQIKTLKPSNEHATRLRLIRELTKKEISQLPEVIREAAAELCKAYAARHNATAALGKSDDALRKAYTAWRGANAVLGKAIAFIKTLTDNAPLLEAWHKSVCLADCPWNGKTIFPESEES